MLSTKIRTTIIALVAASAFAGASVVPAVSQALRHSDQFTHEEICNSRYDAFGEAIRNLRTAQEEGDDAGAKYWREQANDVLGEAWVEECEWVARVQAPTAGLPTVGLVATSSGTLQASTPQAGTIAPARVARAYAALP